MAAAWLLRRFRAWLSAFDVRWLVGIHLTRYVPYAFAVPGGWRDIMVASLAAALLLSGPPPVRP